MPLKLPERGDASFHWGSAGAGPDPFADAAFFEGVIWRRCLAFFIDVGLISAAIVLLFLFNLVTLGLFASIIALVWPALLLVVYATLLIGGAGAGTFGMRAAGIQVRRPDGGKPNYLQAVVISVIFVLVTPATSGLSLLVPLFTARNRAVQDYLAGTIVVNTRDGMV